MLRGPVSTNLHERIWRLVCVLFTRICRSELGAVHWQTLTIGAQKSERSGKVAETHPRRIHLVCSLMSLPLLRHARLCQLATTRRAASRTRCYSASPAHAQLRREPEPGDDDAPVAGPSSAQHEASTATDSVQSRPTLAKHSSPDSAETFSRVQTYLASINASGLQPTLEDLERCRPSRRPSPHSPQYIDTYNELLNTLSRSFTKEQLRQFLVQSLGTSRHCRTHRRKIEYAESIIEQMWEWPTLKDVEKAKRDRTEVATKSELRAFVHVMPPYLGRNTSASCYCERTVPHPWQRYVWQCGDCVLFVHSCLDGSDLLRLSKDYDVHISLRRKPMALRVEGTQGALRDLTEHILQLKQVSRKHRSCVPLFILGPGFCRRAL